MQSHKLALSFSFVSFKVRSICVIGICYRPQTKFVKVMFSQLSVCPQGVSASGLGGVADTTLADTPCWADIPLADTSQADTPWADTLGQTPPPGRHLPRADTSPGQTPALGRHLPRADTSPGQTPPPPWPGTSHHFTCNMPSKSLIKNRILNIKILFLCSSN